MKIYAVSKNNARSIRKAGFIRKSPVLSGRRLRRYQEKIKAKEEARKTKEEARAD